MSQILNSTKDTILFCIDGSRSMQSAVESHEAGPVKTGKRKKSEKTRSHFHQALQCALNVMKRKVVISPNDSLGIMFFNTVSGNSRLECFSNSMELAEKDLMEFLTRQRRKGTSS